MTAGPLDRVEFSRPVDLARLGDAKAVHEIEASGPELAALSRRFGLAALRSLRATVELRRIRGGAAIQLSGRLIADVTQDCVVTLEPVDSRVEEAFTLIYADDASVEESAYGPDPDIAWPEPIPDGPLDIGEAIAQQLSLALDPYPRAVGGELAREWTGEGPGAQNPFAKLAEFRKRPRSSG